MAGTSKGSYNGGAMSGGSYSSAKSLAVTATALKPAGNSTPNREPAKIGGARPRLTSREMDAKRAKGKCFWCDEKFIPGHNCGKRGAFVIQMVEEEDEELEEGNEAFVIQMEEGEGEGLEVVHETGEMDSGDGTGDLQLSLHALWGTKAPKIMRLRGSCQKRVLKVLIDTGSTHNFLSSTMADKMQGKLVEVPPRAVEVANGQILRCTHKCPEFQWKMQGGSFSADVYILRLESYDLILGVQWLSTLGDIRWNFTNLSMIFEMEGVEYRLQGEKWAFPSDHLHCLQVLNHQELQGEDVKLSHIMGAVDGVPWECHRLAQEDLWPELGSLLGEYT